MILADLTWQDVSNISRDCFVMIPTGSLEQHGPHLPLFTDSLLATKVAQGVEKKMPEKLLLTPTLWLGCSGHHLAMNGSLSASFETYMGAIENVIESLIPHGFRKFYVLNGHGGNTEPNGMILRKLKAKYPEVLVGHSGYFAFIGDVCEQIMTGPLKSIRHACEAEASLALHLFPELVKKDKLRDDGLEITPMVRGMVHHFDEITQEGSLGFATYATAEKGQKLYDIAIENIVAELTHLADGYVLSSIFEPKKP